MGGLARLVAINANAIDHSCDGAGCTSKSSCNDLHGEVIEMVAGQGYTLFVLDLLTSRLSFIRVPGVLVGLSSHGVLRH